MRNNQSKDKYLKIGDAVKSLVTKKLNLSGMEKVLFLKWDEIFSDKPLSELRYGKLYDSKLTLYASTGAIAVSAQYMKEQIIEKIKQGSFKFGYEYITISDIKIIRKAFYSNKS